MEIAPDASTVYWRSQSRLSWQRVIVATTRQRLEPRLAVWGSHSVQVSSCIFLTWQSMSAEPSDHSMARWWQCSRQGQTGLRGEELDHRLHPKVRCTIQT